jgi:hypothetical protein
LTKASRTRHAAGMENLVTPGEVISRYTRENVSPAFNWRARTIDGVSAVEVDVLVDREKNQMQPVAVQVPPVPEVQFMIEIAVAGYRGDARLTDAFALCFAALRSARSLVPLGDRGPRRRPVHRHS